APAGAVPSGGWPEGDVVWSGARAVPVLASRADDGACVATSAGVEAASELTRPTGETPARPKQANTRTASATDNVAQPCRGTPCRRHAPDLARAQRRPRAPRRIG